MKIRFQIEQISFLFQLRMVGFEKHPHEKMYNEWLNINLIKVWLNDVFKKDILVKLITFNFSIQQQNMCNEKMN